MKFGIAIEAKIPMMVTTIISSVSVNPVRSILGTVLAFLGSKLSSL